MFSLGMGNEVIWIARRGDLLSCLVVVASESIERYIEPVSGIDLPKVI